MISLKILNATEARAHFFKILKMAASGEDVIIVNKETSQRFKISLLEEDQLSEKEAVLKEMAGINFKSQSPEKMREILLKKYSK
jgi:hypothetical protein